MTPSQLDFISKITLSGAVIIALIIVFKEWTKNLRMQEEERKELLENQDKHHNAEMNRLKDEIDRLRQNEKELHMEYKEDRKEWLKALNNNTEVLRDVANMIKHLPKIEDDMSNLKDDVSDIKSKIRKEGVKND